MQLTINSLPVEILSKILDSYSNDPGFDTDVLPAGLEVLGKYVLSPAMIFENVCWRWRKIINDGVMKSASYWSFLRIQIENRKTVATFHEAVDEALSRGSKAVMDVRISINATNDIDGESYHSLFNNVIKKYRLHIRSIAISAPYILLPQVCLCLQTSWLNTSLQSITLRPLGSPSFTADFVTFCKNFPRDPSVDWSKVAADHFTADVLRCLMPLYISRTCANELGTEILTRMLEHQRERDGLYLSSESA